MARAEDTILRRLLENQQEVGRLRGQIVQNLDVEGTDRFVALDAVRDIADQLVMLQHTRLIYEDILKTTKKATDWEELVAEAKRIEEEGQDG